MFDVDMIKEFSVACDSQIYFPCKCNEVVIGISYYYDPFRFNTLTAGRMISFVLCRDRVIAFEDDNFAKNHLLSLIDGKKKGLLIETVFYSRTMEYLVIIAIFLSQLTRTRLQSSILINSNRIT